MSDTTETKTEKQTKYPRGPFWAWNDIGSGMKWHMCVIRGSEDEPMIYYVQEDFEDYWYDEDWSEGEIKTIRTPNALE